MKIRWGGICFLLCLATIVLASCTPSRLEITDPNDAFLSGLSASNAEVLVFSDTLGIYPGALTSMVDTMNFIHVSVNEGLSQGIVNVLFQDTAGFIWIGTENGLNRYDGYQFIVFKNDSADAQSISNNAIRDVIEDQAGNLWIATEGGLNMLARSTGKFTRYLHHAEDLGSISSNFINCILEDGDHFIWIGTTAGLDMLDPATGEIAHFTNDPNDAYSLPGNSVNALLVDDKDRLWVGTNSGLGVYNPLSHSFTNHLYDPDRINSLSSNHVLALAQDEQGAVWVGTQDGGLDRYDGAQMGFTRFEHEQDRIFSLSSDTVTDVFIAADGTIWVGTPNGLNRMSVNTNYFHHYSSDPEDIGGRESLSSPQVTYILEDRSGVLWIGTNGGGLNLFDATSQRFARIQHETGNPNSLSSSSVNSILVDAYNNLWIATSYGLNRYDPATGTYHQYLSDPSSPLSLNTNNIQVLYEDRSGILWMGTDHGLDYYDREHDRIIQYQPDIEQYRQSSIDLSQIAITAIRADSENNLWLGTRGSGLIKVDLGTNEMFVYTHQAGRPESIGSNDVRCLAIDDKGRVWVGTALGGLNLFDPRTGHFIRYQNEPGSTNTISNDTVNAILEDSHRRFWVGTNSGLNLLDPETGGAIVMREKDGLANDMVFAILEDKSGQLWISTGNGLSRYQPDTGTFKNFDIRDGLQSNEFTVGAAYRDEWGVLYFGGSNGLNIFNPGQMAFNSYDPPIVMTTFSQRGNELFSAIRLSDQSQIVLQWPNNFFDFGYSALSFIQQDKNQYAYKLENFDRDWNMVGSRRYGSYTNLPGGTYTLRIVGSNNDGIWNTHGVSIVIKVLPPFWLTAWFQIGLAAILIAGGFTGYRLRVRSIEQNSRKLAVQVAERTREIEQRRQAADGLRDVLALLNSDRSLEDSLFFIACQIQKLIDACQIIIFSIIDKKFIRFCVQCRKGQERSANFLKKSVYQLHPSPQDARWLIELATAGKPYSTANFQTDVHLSPEMGRCLDREAHAMAFMPILQGGEAIGGLVVLFRKARLPAHYETYLFELFADQAALAIGNSNLRTRVEDLAVMAERNRLARDLHDAVTQTLFSASLIAEALPSTWEGNKREGRKLLGELRQLTRGALAEMRSLLMELRPRSVADARLVDLLHQLAEATIGRTGMNVSVNAPADLPLPQDVHLGLYRIAQEALANTVRHARARKVQLVLEEEMIPSRVAGLGDRVHVILGIRDNGRGFVVDDVPSDHFGLRNMKERAQAIGAEIRIDSTPKKGTTISIEWTGEVRTNE